MTELERKRLDIEMRAKIQVLILEREAEIAKLRLQLECPHAWETFTHYDYGGGSDRVTRCQLCGWTR